MSSALTYWIEVAVGLGCVALALAARRRRMPCIAVLLILAGVLAVAHGVVALT